MDKKFEEFLMRMEAREVRFESMAKNLETRVEKVEAAFEMVFDVTWDQIDNFRETHNGQDIVNIFRVRIEGQAAAPRKFHRLSYKPAAAVTNGSKEVQRGEEGGGGRVGVGGGGFCLPIGTRCK